MTEDQLVPRVTNPDPDPDLTRLSPADRKFADLPPGKYYKLTEVAQILGCSPGWLRKKLKDPDITAPSLQLPLGGKSAPAYVYTQQDIEELREIWRAAPVRRN